MSTEINEKLTSEQLIKKFASINNISEEEALALIGADTEEEIYKKIEEYTLQRINEQMPKLNRAQRRALAKKSKKKQHKPDVSKAISETTKKINYINLIQDLRELNKKKENENYEDAIEDN